MGDKYFILIIVYSFNYGYINKRGIIMITISFENLIDKLLDLKKIMANGEEIILEDSGHPIAKITPFNQPKKRKLGGEAGKIWISEDFNGPLPDDLLKEFYK